MKTMTVAFLACFCGCVHAVVPATKEAVYEGTHIEIDDFKKTKVAFGPIYQFDRWHRMYLGKRVDVKSPPVLHFTAILSDWAFFESAVDSDGRTLGFKVIDHNVGGGSFVSEDLAIVLDQDILEAKIKEAGYAMRIYGKRDNYVLRIPSSYIEGWLAKLKELESTVQK